MPPEGTTHGKPMIPWEVTVARCIERAGRIERELRFNQLDFPEAAHLREQLQCHLDSYGTLGADRIETWKGLLKDATRNLR